MRIRAAVLEGANRPFVVQDVDLAPPRHGEVLVGLRACGVCHSDYHLATGDTKHPMPAVAGHEGAGVVEAVGEGVAKIKVGDHVVLSWAPDCGHCFYCLAGKPNLCDTYVGPLWDGTMLDGTPRLSQNGKPIYHYCGLAAFAEKTVVPECCCIPIPHDVPMPTASLVGCAVATGVGAALRTVTVAPGDRVVVFGCGGVGLSIVMGARLAGAGQIIAVDVSPTKLQTARWFGATDAVDGRSDPIVEIKRRTNQRGADYVFEAVGLTSLQEMALEVVRPGGTLVLVGLSPMGTGTNLPGAKIARQEITIKGSYYGSVSPRRDFPLLIELYRTGQLPLDQLVSKEYSLDQLSEAFAAMLSGETSRGVVVY